MTIKIIIIQAGMPNSAQSNHGCYIPAYVSLLMICLIKQSLNVALKSVPTCESQLLLLYSNVSRELPATTTSNFSVTFSNSYLSSPIAAIGNSGYSSLDQLYNQLWGVRYTLHSNFTGMVVNVRLQTNTKMNMLLVCYFVASSTFMPGLFNIYSNEFSGSSELVNTSSGTGTRVDTFTSTAASVVTGTPVSSLNPTSIIVCYTNVMYMRNVLNFGFTVSCNLVISGTATVSGIRYVVTSTGDNRLQKIAMMTIVIDKTKINTDNFYQAYTGSTVITSNNTILSLYSLSPANSTTTTSALVIEQLGNSHLMMAFSSWGSTNPGLAANFFFSLSLDANNTKYIRISNPNRITTIDYNYMVFGEVDCMFWDVPMQACVTACALGKTDGSVDKMCRTCSSACINCTNFVNNCTACASNYYLLNTVCELCNISVLRSECGYVPPNNTNTTNTTNNTTVDPNTPTVPDTTGDTPRAPVLYMLAFISIVPIIGIAVYCYCRSKVNSANSAAVADSMPNFREFPSMEF